MYIPFESNSSHMVEYLFLFPSIPAKTDGLLCLAASSNRYMRTLFLKKLSNERFVSNAPEQVVAVERKKQSDAEEKIKMLKEQIANLQ